MQLVNSDAKGEAANLVQDEVMRAIRILPEAHERKAVAFPEEDTIGAFAAFNILGASTASTKVDLEVFAGTYRDPGYGEYVFCPPPRSASLGGMTSRCTEVFDAYSSLENVTALSHKKLYGYMVRPSIWADYLTLSLLPDSSASNNVTTRLNNTEKNVNFELHYTRVFPKGYGADTNPYEYDFWKSAGFRAVFPYEDDNVVGFGIFGFAGVVLEREKRGRSVQERAEAWFVKD